MSERSRPQVVERVLPHCSVSYTNASSRLPWFRCIHPQLRDLLVCPNQAGQVVALAYHSLAMYDFPRTVSTSSPLGRISTGKQPARKVRFTPNAPILTLSLILLIDDSLRRTADKHANAKFHTQRPRLWLRFNRSGRTSS